ncbi:hypothetical protein SFRURICE_021476, partial [Spodoptera frugiperda]
WLYFALVFQTTLLFVLVLSRITTNFVICPIYNSNLSRLPRWPSGYKFDCRTRGLEFDFRVGRRHGVWNYAQYNMAIGPPTLHGTDNTNGDKWVYIAKRN